MRRTIRRPARRGREGRTTLSDANELPAARGIGHAEGAGDDRATSAAGAGEARPIDLGVAGAWRGLPGARSAPAARAAADPEPTVFGVGAATLGAARAARPSYGGILLVLGLLNAGALAGIGAVALPDPLWAFAAGLVATTAVPGALLALLLVPAESVEPGEWAALAAGLGAAALILGGLLLAALGTGIGPVAVIFWTATLGLVLSGLAFRRALAWSPPRPRAPGASLDALLVLLLGASLRLPSLGYSELQGDETEVVLRATAVVQGLPDALFHHGKGPGEVVATAVHYGLVERISEGAARLPFALAELAGLVAFYVLARAVLGRPGALVAALALVLNGYLIAFARIAQYQGLVLLLSVLAVWCALRWSETGRACWPVLAGLFAAVGALAHYDAVFALPPILLLALRRGGVRGLLERDAPRAWGLGALVGLAVLAVFFGPYLASPLAGLATGRIADRVGAGFPRDNLAGILASASFYTSASYLLLLAGLAGLGALRPLARGRGPAGWAWLLGLVWFAVPFLFYAFVARKPGTHIHVAFAGLALLAGWGFATAWAALARRPARAALAGLAAAGAGVVLLYVVPVYLQTAPEVVREGGQGRLPLVWSLGPAPEKERFGFPYQAGWKAVGALFADGTLRGSYGSNEVPQVTHWYTRGAWRCAADPRYFIIAENVQDEIETPRRRIQAEYGPIGVVTVNGREKLRIHERGAPRDARPTVWRAEDLADRFEQDASRPTLDPGIWARGPLGPNATRTPVRYGEAVELLGYQMYAEDARPGGRVRVDLAWLPLVSADRAYGIDLRLGDEPRAGDGNGAACDSNNPSEDWVAGAPFVQRASIPIDPQARPGAYPLLVGVSRLDTRGAAAPPATDLPTRGALVDIGTVQIGGGTAGAPPPPGEARRGQHPRGPMPGGAGGSRGRPAAPPMPGGTVGPPGMGGRPATAHVAAARADDGR
jgi:hypothetical protein